MARPFSRGPGQLFRRTRLGLSLARIVEPMSPARVKEIRKKVASSPQAFERFFGIPARTVEGWEQRVLLLVIEKNPKAVEKALATD